MNSVTERHLPVDRTQLCNRLPSGGPNIDVAILDEGIQRFHGVGITGERQRFNHDPSNLRFRIGKTIQ